MEKLDRFDVVEVDGALAVVVESSFLPPTPAVVVIPLLYHYPLIRELNPRVSFGGEAFVLATRLIGPVRRARARKRGTVEDQSDTVTRAVDVMMAGV